MDISEYMIILGSASPRRKELLRGLGLEFTVDTNNSSDESYDPDMPHDEIPVHIARSKSLGFHRALSDKELLITADTMVFCDGRIMGKPSGPEEAAEMLRYLAGKTHTVTTGVCLRTHDKEKCFSCTSKVTFKQLSDKEINHYIEHYKPFDKAGAYGIQEWIGYIGITSIEGSYYNIMGLPVQRLYQEIESF